MNVLCTQCKKVYTTRPLDKPFLIFLIAAITIMIVMILAADNFIIIKSNPYILIIALPILIVGFILDFYIRKEDRDCRVCHGKKTLIAIDTPEAIEIIKENNLSILKDSQENKLPWQTS